MSRLSQWVSNPFRTGRYIVGRIRQYRMKWYAVSNPFRTGRYIVGYAMEMRAKMAARFKPLQNGAVYRSYGRVDRMGYLSHKFQTPSEETVG